MFFKLSLKNVRKSLSDYSLYFLTLTLSVCIFYVFNSIEAQKAMMRISESTNQMMKTVTQFIGMISVIISFILGFLIVYANSFLIRRRKKEIGIYMTLGIEKRKVARLLAAETFIIGIMSLGAGLLTGVFLSQGLSVITAKLFEVDMTGYRFVFSPEAFVKTIIYFGIIFTVVMILSIISISKYKLINLINADKQNEKPKLRNPWLTVILFILSAACLGTAYVLVLKNGIFNFDNRLKFEVLLGTLGTFLFFASLSGFFLRLLQSNKKLYYKGLNMFILRQINSRINTAHISMSFICLMLFCTIGVLSTGLGANRAISDSYSYSAPFDASLRIGGNVRIAEMLKEYGLNLNDYADKMVEYSLYRDEKETLTKGAVLEKVWDYLPKKTYSYYTKTPLYLIRLSDYNRLMELQGKNEIKLSDSEIAIYSDNALVSKELKNALLKFIGLKEPVTISGNEYKVNPVLLTDGVMTSPSTNLMLALVVPDKLTDKSEKSETILSLNCRGDSTSMQNKLEADLSAIGNNIAKPGNIKIRGTTREVVKAIAAGSKALVAFVGIYLGIIFLITSAAVLALQQLSEAADNRKRYNILQKIGADEALISSALLKQIAIYFLMPLVLAGIHSIVGIKVANDVITDVGHINALNNIILTAVLIAIVYGFYFLATFFSSRQIVLNNKQTKIQ